MGRAGCGRERAKEGAARHLVQLRGRGAVCARQPIDVALHGMQVLKDVSP